jgi:acyl-coenzyme A thioesterase PaaI-like protein
MSAAQKTAILAQVGHFYFGAVGQYYVGANSKWIFSRLLCLKAPYFGSIRPRFEQLRQEYCEVRVRKRRAVLNHLGSVHAIAMCNMAELAGGTMTEVTVPATHRWIPKSMTVQYLKIAKTDLIAVASPHSPLDVSGPGEFQVDVVVKDEHGESVFNALITMWVAPRKVESRAA